VRVLYLCHRIPYPPDKGDKIRAFHWLRALSGHHEVDLFTLADDPADLRHRAELARYSTRIVAARLRPAVARLRSLPSLLGRKPLTLPYFYSSRLAAEVRAALRARSYDRIFVYSSSMAQYVPWERHIPVVLDLVDLDSDKWKQYAEVSRFPFSRVYRREAGRLRVYEREVCEKAACVLVTTAREAELTREVCPTARVEVISNGVDTGYFDPAAVPPDPRARAIVFVGDMAYFPNQDAVASFAAQVLPAVRETLPETPFLIVGRNPGRKVRDLEKIPGVTVTGFVPDVRHYLARSAVSVAPFSIAAGIQNKILEAMAYGLPVVATPRAAQGLSPAVAAAVRTAANPREMADAVVHLLRDPLAARNAGMEGRRRVSREYGWDAALEKLIAVVESPAADGRRIALGTKPGF
jgi:sugar transferase (PEP-CTERM/EpsH1 system associated)